MESESEEIQNQTVAGPEDPCGYFSGHDLDLPLADPTAQKWPPLGS